MMSTVHCSINMSVNYTTQAVGWARATYQNSEPTAKHVTKLCVCEDNVINRTTTFPAKKTKVMKLGLIVSPRSDLQRHHRVWNGNAGKEKVHWQTSHEFAMFSSLLCSVLKIEFLLTYLHILWDPYRIYATERLERIRESGKPIISTCT